MFNRFKSALYNVVGNFDPAEGGSIGSIGTVSLASGVQNIPSVLRQNSNPGKEKTYKFPYTRPHFLQLNSEDEILVTADHALRPIVCPRDISRLPWNSGYAETVNAGKSKRNEDQAAIHVGLLTRSVKRKPSSAGGSIEKGVNSKKTTGTQVVNGFADKDDASANGFDHSVSEEQNGLPASEVPSKTPLNANDLLTRTNSTIENEDQECIVSLPYYYFGVFDGHAGWGAAVSAANQLHHIIHEKLCDVIELIIPDAEDKSALCGPFWSLDKTVSAESAIIGALEQAFWTMDQQIAEDRQRHHLSGGCTACIALFILGKVFVSNAGDSRGIIGHESVPFPMSFDFTPETETQRIRKLGARHPELLGGEFTHLEFLRRPLKSDVGKKAPFRDHYMRGWGLKTITEADLKYPLVCGEGKRSRVLATIGVTRGFGDHDLKAQFSSLPIKPFLSPEPEVRVFDLTKAELTDKDVLILGTDGLWDIMSNERAVSVVCSSLAQFPPEDPHRYRYRYTSAAHDLVLWSRGRLKEHNWRTCEDKHSTIDDISVFVVPLKPYQMEAELWHSKTSCEVGVDLSEGLLVSSGEGAASSAGGVVSSGKGVVSSERGAASSGGGVASSLKGVVSSGRGAASSGGGVASSGKGVVSSERGSASSGGSVTSSGKGVVSSERGATSSERSVASSGKGVVSSELGAASSGKGVVSTDRGAALQEENVTSCGEERCEEKNKDLGVNDGSGFAAEELPTVPILLPSKEVIGATQQGTIAVASSDETSMPTSTVQSEVLEFSQHQSIVSSNIHSSQPTTSTDATVTSSTTSDSVSSSADDKTCFNIKDNENCDT